MSDSLDIDSDPFLKLLTDALRAGPGSPEWHQAVAKLKAGSQPNVDEYRMLVAAREHLESGKTYREVRPGVGFTRKVMSGIENDTGGKKRGIPTASAIAVTGAIVILTVLGLVGYWILHGNNSGPGENLSNAYFSTIVSSATFDGPLTSEWRMIGPLQVDPAKGLRPAPIAPPTTRGAADYSGGGIVTSVGIPANQSFVVEATFHFQHVTDDVIPQVFITNQPDFSPDRATSPHELVWLVRGSKAQVVLPDGQITDATDKIHDGQTVTVRIIVGQEAAQIVSGGRTLWAGLSQLTNTPRSVGIRFLRRGNDKRDAVVAQSIKVMEK